MPAISATAPGKCILLGEHAVVYSRPAIAVPVFQVQAKAVATAAIQARPGSIHIQAPDIQFESELDELPVDHPLAIAVRGVIAALQISHVPAVTLRISSTIPIAGGLGSGAAVSVALIRAFSTFLGRPMPPEQVNALAFEVEKRLHGTPSGIDNTVVTYGQPVYFVKGQPPKPFQVARPFSLVIADSGIPSPTAQTVGSVRLAWQADPQRYEALFDQVAGLVDKAMEAIQSGHPELLGPRMDANHSLLQQMGVSIPELDRLVETARAAGAQGAKLSGGGRGGNIIALVETHQVAAIIAALETAGAVRAFATQVR